MRDLLSKLDAIVSETELKNPKNLQDKLNALADLEKDPVASDDPEISSAITQKKSDLEREAKSKGFEESFEVGDEFGISFSEDHEIATTIVDILEDGIVIELDDTALDMLTNEGLNFLEGELEESVAGPKKCWKGYRKTGTQPGTGKNAGKRVNDCEKIGEDAVEESGLQYYTGVKKHGEEYMKKAAAAGRAGASQKELGALKDKYSKAHKNEDHGPENPDAPVNYGEYDREGDMAKDDLRTIDDAVEELYSILRADDNLPEWVQSKITKAVDYIDTARDYMKAQKYEEGVDEDSLDSIRDKLRNQGLGSPRSSNDLDRFEKEKDLRTDYTLNSIANRSKEDNARTQHEIDVLAHKLKRMDRDDDDWKKTFDMMRDRINRYQWSSQRDVDPEQLKKITDIKYEPQKQNEAAQAKTDDKLRQYYADLKAKKQAEKDKQQGVAEGDVDEAKYQGREVPLGKKMAGDVKKSKVYVRKPNGNIVKVNFGDKKMRIKKSNPARRKSFRARHNCANPGPRHKARYWSCRSW